MKHSPGPWTVDKEAQLVCDGHGTPVADLSILGRKLSPQAEANAKLIAAAPLLYAVIERIVLHSDEPSIFTLNEILEEARTAIELVRKHEYQS